MKGISMHETTSKVMTTSHLTALIIIMTLIYTVTVAIEFGEERIRSLMNLMLFFFRLFIRMFLL